MKRKMISMLIRGAEEITVREHKKPRKMEAALWDFLIVQTYSTGLVQKLWSMPVSNEKKLNFLDVLRKKQDQLMEQLMSEKEEANHE